MTSFDNNMDFIDVFEEKLTQYTGFKYAVTTDCCTNAIAVSLEVLHLRGELNKDTVLHIPKYTYMSVPFMLMHYGWKVQLVDQKWSNCYAIGSTGVIDAATDLDEHMSSKSCYTGTKYVCISFQQKKRLSLGRGGAILTNDDNFAAIAKRLRYDGRNPKISDKNEVQYMSKDILHGFHCYLEPDKAARGILLLNQSNMLLPYKVHSYVEYPDLSILYDHIR